MISPYKYVLCMMLVCMLALIYVMHNMASIFHSLVKGF